MPSFAELREKAAKARTSGLTKLSDTRDRYSSKSSKDIDWTVDHKRSASVSSSSVSPSPPPPPRLPPPTHSSASSTHNVPNPSPPPAPPSRAPPVIRRDNRPDIISAVQPPAPPPRSSPVPQPRSPPVPPPRSSPVPAYTSAPLRPKAPPRVVSDTIDWAHLSQADKEVFFSWLDEFFERYLNIKIPPRHTTPTVQVSSRPLTPPKAPSVNLSSRPVLSRHASSDTSNFAMSYPSPSVHGSAAEDLAHYFTPSTHWDSAWYTNSELAPPLQGADPPNWTAIWSAQGSRKTIYAGILFPDLSMCWYTVSFSTALSADPNDARSVVRSARYLPRPNARDKETLVAASEMYGETIAAYAESFEGTGQYCARGECWDLANEALKQFAQYDSVPKPVPSISRTHGHLIFEGRAEQNGAVQVGRWRGGDDRVRRGDIVEWRSARVGMGRNGYAMLGSPDHTAVIVSEMVPKARVMDGQGVKPSEMGTLEVVEQSVGSPPKRGRYDLNLFQEGEVWIYRPIGMLEYVGALLEPKCPEDVNALSV